MTADARVKMFNSVKHSLPAVDYVSIVRSVYGDRKALFFGALAGFIAASLSAYKTHSIALMVVAILIVVAGAMRYWNMMAFWSANVSHDDADAAEYWEFRATVGGGAVAAIYGAWCFVSLAIVDDSFAALIAISMSATMMVGVVARNFGLDRLVTLQTSLLCVPLATGLLLVGDIYHGTLAGLLSIMLISFRKLAGDTRTLLLNAVHDRVNVSRLAVERDTALNTMTHGLCMLDEAGRISVVNQQAEVVFFGSDPSRCVGALFTDVVFRAQQAGFISATSAEYLLAEIDAGDPVKIVLNIPDNNQCEITINSQAGHTVLMFENITERVRANERISYMARYDGLTKLANRAFFTEQAEARLKEIRATESAESAMLMIVDIDDFKHVNDTFGHPVGDALLVKVARRVQEVFGSNSIVARFGGDEFIVFNSGDITVESIECQAKKVLEALQLPYEVHDQVLAGNASIGIVLEHGESALETLLTRADLALYTAKGEGKARWCLFHDQMDVEYRERQRLKTDLHGALDRNEFSLFYQPIIDLRTKKIAGCEALIRWNHKELGFVPPMLFIPIAEESGVMAEISQWVIKTAARECAAWPDDITISVNLSATDFRNGNIEEMVDDALDGSGLDPRRLIIEITETALIEERELATNILKRVRSKGVGIALDDFGTGYSSLSYLHTLPFTKLKIDRSFVVDVVSNKRSQQMLANIARLSKDLNLTVTVEGIETDEQLQIIARSAEVDHAQGYLFGAPLPRNEILKLMGHTLPHEVQEPTKKRRLKKS